MNTTNWFDGLEYDPVRVGLYQCKHRTSGVEYFKYWNGNSWFLVRYVTKKRFILLDLPDLFDWQYPIWRGLSEKFNKGGIT